jgi:transcriptional regulator with XRE-family HTH domain
VPHGSNVSAHREARDQIAWQVERPDPKLHEKLVGHRIRELRGNFDYHRPLSQDGLAKLSGLSRPRISALERGVAGIVRVHELVWIANALGVPLRALFQRDLGETSASSLGLPAYLTRTMTDRETPASSDVTPEQIDALSARCDAAEQLSDSGQFWRVEHLLEQLLPDLAAAAGTTTQNQAQLSRLRVRMTIVCAKRVDAEIRHLRLVQQNLVTQLRVT